MFEVGDIIADTDAGLIATVTAVAPAISTYVLEYEDGSQFSTDFSDSALMYPCPECGGAEISTGQVFGSDIKVFVCEKCGEEWT